MFTGILLGLLGVVAVVVVTVIIRFEYVIRKCIYRPVGIQEELPTVSVCIPARNEKHAMTECLERVLASEYPKLEIIVLDDSSVDETSMLIKSFAHAGVRFVEGRPLPDGWLGKNNALQGLLEEASGRYILFLDVDTTLKPHSITSLISWARSRSLSLASVIPQREDGLRASVFLGTMRYFWVLFLGSSKSPAVSGASWVVERQKLQDIGGFAEFKKHTQPEVAIAHALSAADRSHIVISNKQLGIGYEKKWMSQVETSIRLLRPLFGSAVGALAVAVLLAAIVFVPIVSLVTFVLQAYLVGAYAALLVLTAVTILSLRYFKTTWGYGWWLGAVHWPYVVLQEALLLITSVIMYARGTVTWKGRPIKKSTPTD